MSLATLYLSCGVLAGMVALASQPRIPRALLLLALACVPQLLAMVGVRHSALALVSLLLCLAWYRANRDLPGATLLAAGMALNLGAMTFHGGAMPVTVETLAALGHKVEPGLVLQGMKDSVVAWSPIWWLGDCIILPTPWRTMIISPGDLLVAAGLLRWLCARTSAGHEENHAPLSLNIARAVRARPSAAE